MKKTLKFILVFLVLMIVFLGIGLIYTFSNGFNENIKAFYVKYNNARIVSNISDPISLSDSLENKFEIFYLKTDDRNYNISIKSYCTKENHFTYGIKTSSNLDYYKWNNDLDFSNFFDIKKEETNFSITLKDVDYSLSSMISRLYENDELVLENDIDVSNTPYLSLNVELGNDKIIIPLLFVPIESVELDNNGVVFYE